MPYHNLSQSIRNNTVLKPLILYRVFVVLYVDRDLLYAKTHPGKHMCSSIQCCMLYVDCIDSPSVTKGAKGQDNESKSGQKICSECAFCVCLFVFTPFCSSKQMFILVRRQ